MSSIRSSWTGFLLLALLATVFQPRPAAGQATAALVIEVSMGQLGTAAELIRMPLVGRLTLDPTWIYDSNPDGTDNPAFPPAPPALILPTQPTLPGIVPITRFWISSGEPGRMIDPGHDQSGYPQPVILQKTLVVGADQKWVPSGISVGATDRIWFLAEGQWSYHFNNGDTDPDGATSYGPLGFWPGHPPPPSTTAPPLTLMGRIANGTPFVVGRRSVMIAGRAGELFFMGNDLYDDGPGISCRYCGAPNGHVSNNRGSVTLIIRVQPDS